MKIVDGDAAGAGAGRREKGRRDIGAGLMRKVQALRSLEFFEGCHEEGLFRLAELALLRRFARGRTILETAGNKDCVILCAGRALCSLGPGARSDLSVSIFEPGELLSEVCSVSQASLEVVALEACETLHLGRSVLHDFLEQHPRTSLRFLEATTQRLSRVVDLVANLSSYDIGDRLYLRLMEFVPQRGKLREDGSLCIEHGLKQSELAASIGASREAVNRQLRVWREAGLVDAGRFYLIVLDPLGLSMAVSGVVRVPGPREGE